MNEYDRYKAFKDDLIEAQNRPKGEVVFAICCMVLLGFGVLSLLVYGIGKLIIWLTA